MSLSDVKVFRYGKFSDSRGYFTETFRKSDVFKNSELSFLRDFDFVQINESFGNKGVIKGLHFQWEPALGKLVRVVSGHMLDLALDIRKNSPTYGKIIIYDMPDNAGENYGEWIWLPPGFAHGCCFLTDTIMEYFFTANWNPDTEAGIAPVSDGLDWSLCEPDLKTKFNSVLQTGSIVSERDNKGLSLKDWTLDLRSKNIIY